MWEVVVPGGGPRWWSPRAAKQPLPSQRPTGGGVECETARRLSQWCLGGGEEVSVDGRWNAGVLDSRGGTQCRVSSGEG